jgi:DNA-binding TFAR19-related protein (PDSD5 family)
MREPNKSSEPEAQHLSGTGEAATDQAPRPIVWMMPQPVNALERIEIAMPSLAAALQRVLVGLRSLGRVSM